MLFQVRFSRSRSAMDIKSLHVLTPMTSSAMNAADASYAEVPRGETLATIVKAYLSRCSSSARVMVDATVAIVDDFGCTC